MTDKWEPPQRRNWFRVCIFITVLLTAAVALFLPQNTRTARGSGARTQALNNIRNVSLALLNYSAQNGQLPPAYTVDSNNRPLHSWRTLVLPWLDEQALYDSLDLTKAWDDPVNQHAWDKMPDVYGSPGHDLGVGMTAICVPVGFDHCFQAAGSKEASDITGLASEVIMLAQVSEEATVHWMEPKDTAVEYLSAPKSFGRPFYGGVILVGMADGSVRVISLDTDDIILKSLLSISESVSADGF